MKFKSKNGETMVWLEDIKTMVDFAGGEADVDERIGALLIKKGYIESSKPEVKEEEPKKVVESKPQMKKQPEAKPLKPIKPLAPEKSEESEEINSEV